MRSPAPAHPSGTVTFLFSDIEGSTQRWERDRNAMDAALARHDAVLHAAIAAHGGYVFKTVGDAFCAAFATAPAALGAALDAQRALRAEDFLAVGGLHVRMALHTGTAQERARDYFGPAVNRVARLLSIGHGGQVLVSGTTADLMQGELPPHGTLRDLGARRLKDLARPEHVYQLAAPDLDQAFPELRSLDELPNNLPPQLTSFVGRENDVAEIKRLLKNNRLVTLVGSGGAGKTRCAIQAGAELLDPFADGVWLVELASISDASLVTAEIAQTLGVRERPNRPLLETLIEYLERRELLLIVDNCEHLIDEVRPVAAAILRACAGARVLATSRESLNIAGEHVFRLPSLAVPVAYEGITAQDALQFGAVALFADRALASDARFALTDDNAPSVTEISQRLDGIPLAIELAAARVKVLSPRQLAERLNERFRVLTGGDRSALPRHQTMRALIDWSYDLLTEPERGLFRKLSIFAGGFTLESAGAVCADDAVDEIAVLDVLSSLVDKSLVQADPSGDQRYRLLESTRQYAREKLIAAGEHPAAVRAHALAFLSLAERFEETWEETPDRDWFAQAELELENWRAALEWALAGRADVALGQRMAASLGRIWALPAAAEGRRWIRVALESVDDRTPPTIVARLDLSQAQLDAVLGRHGTSYAAAERALAGYRALDDQAGIATAERYMGSALVMMGRIEEGEVLLGEALAVFRARGAQKLIGAVLDSLAVARSAVGDVAGARGFYAEALAIFNATGAEWLAGAAAINLAEAEFSGGDPAEALRLAEEALSGVRAGNVTRVALLLGNMAAYLIALDRHEEARLRARDALARAHNTHFEVFVLWALQHLAAVAALRADEDPRSADVDRRRAARLFGYVDARVASLEARRMYTEQHEHERSLAALRDALGHDELERLSGEGRSWNEERAVTESLLVQ
ncbi:MAG: adenylate/guanylate cyclase domain-containing protein [Candidatus Baltobacteraceae bacterium]